MITSIALTDTHSIGIDSYGKFMVDDNKVGIKEVPFVRYKFNKFEDMEVKYIKEMQVKFPHSSHLAEVNISDDIEEVVDRLYDIDGLIVYVYVSIEDKDVYDGLSEEMLLRIEKLKGLDVERIMLKDNSVTLHNVAAIKLKKEIASLLKIKDWNNIGVCSSPLSFDGNNACLTAVRARELSAKYADRDDIALPSANHECMNTCGCIRYYTFTGSVAAPTSTTKKVGTNKKVSTSEKEDSVEKQPKKKKVKGYLKW